MFFEFIMDKGRRFENDQGKRWKLGISVFSPVSWNPKQNAAVQQRHKDRFFKCQNFTLKKSLSQTHRWRKTASNRMSNGN